MGLLDRDLSVTNCIKEGWQSFTANPALSIGAFFTYSFMMAMGQIIPIFGFFFWLLVSPALTGGFILLVMNLAGRSEAKIDDLFQGFQQFGRLLGAYWLMVAAAMIGIVPSFAVTIFSIGVATESVDPGPLLLFVYFVNIVALGLFFIRWSMVLFIVMDEPYLGVFDCFRRSEQITSGNRVNLALLGFLSMFIALAGFLALFVGYIVAAPVIWLSFARAYFWLRSYHPPVKVQLHPQAQVDPGPALQ